MTHTLRSFVTEARRDLSEDKRSRFLIVLLAAMVVGLVIGAALGREFAISGLLFLAGGIPASTVVAVCYHATSRIRKAAAVVAVALVPVWVMAALVGAITGSFDPGLLMASDVDGFSYVGSFVQGIVMLSAIQGGIVLLKGLQNDR